MIIDGEGLQGVTVTLVGGPSDESFTMTTDVDGMYRFEDLRPGDYTVSISDFDTRDYEFAATSQDVSVDLDETGTVSFTGVLLRTSGISGRVSVEGMGLDGITVTLSGAADATKTTDAGGQYSFSGLAAGDYTVTIAVDDPAYVFDEMSRDVTVGDDESAIENFEGQHARTASVSGMAFIDELDNNDMMDAGEDPLAAAGIPVALVGPGVNDQRLSATDADGAFSFSGLRAGSYQLVVPIDATTAATLAAGDVAYGGPGTGYAFALGVGESKSQAIPFDITHTTVNFTVSLKSGEEMGDPLPGASVSLYGANSAMVGSGMTDDEGSVSIKVARAMTSGNMVNAGVSAEGYDVADGMTEVSWDPQKFVTTGANSNDIVNLNVDVSISGATVMTEYGGGAALAGWAISVMMGDAAVEGAPTMLGDDGSVPFTTTVESVPASFTFTVADDQDDELDGGEMYEASGGGYTHTGLKVAGATGDADPIEVRYTTQTLKVYVHHELDQVHGYTGNVGHGDVRMSGLVDIEVRQAGSGSLTSPISNDDWDSRANSHDDEGEYTFKHLPADMDIVVRAEARDDFMLLDHNRLDTYRNPDEFGVEDGAFGAMGGWGHTVRLCSLKKVDPTAQDFGECASFAVVSTYEVTANVSKQAVQKRGTTFRVNHHTITRQSGVEVSLTPTPGKNLGGVGRSFETASSDDPTTAHDERRFHDFGTMAAGAYDLGIPDGWMAMAGDMDADDALSPLGDNLALEVMPSTATLYGFVRNTDGFGLEGVTVTVNGQSATTDDLGRYIVSGISAVRGQLFVNTERAGYPAAKADSTNNPKGVVGDNAYDPNYDDVPDFGANTVSQHNFTLSGANNTVTITGTVTDSDTGAGIKGVEIKVNGSAPLNAGSGQGSGQLTTGDDGTYTAIIETQPSNTAAIVNVTAHKSGYHFQPPSVPVPAIAGLPGRADFTGYEATEIVGRVTAPGGGMPRAEVTVRAYADMAKTDTLYAVTTTETGTFSVFVPTLSGTVYLDANPQDDYTPSDPNYVNLLNAERYVWFDPPAARSDGSIAVIPGQTLQFGTFTGNSVQPRITQVRRGSVKTDVEDAAATNPIVPAAASRISAAGGFLLVKGEPTDTIEVTWQYETRNTYAAGGGAAAAYSAEDGADNAELESDGTSPSAGVTTPASILVPAGPGGVPAAVLGRGAATNGTTVRHTRVTTYAIPAADAANYGDIELTIGHDVVDADGVVRDETVAVSASEDLAAVAESVSRLTVTRSGTSITATWFGPGSPQLDHRIALYVNVGATQNVQEWVVFPGDQGPGTAIPQPDETRATTIPANTGRNWGRWSWTFNLDVDGDSNPTTLVSSTWPDDHTGSSHTVTGANLVGAMMLRVDTRVDDGDWTMTHNAATIP